MSIVDTDNTNEVVVGVYCPSYMTNRKYLEDKYAWRVINFKDETSIEDIFQQEVNRELLKAIGLDLPENDSSVIAALVFGVTDRSTAMLMKLELGSD
jgi:hypothetical protein